MFERFTDRARRVIVISEEEARALGHSFIRPEHLYLGLLQGDGIAAKVLAPRAEGVDAARERFSLAISSSNEATKVVKVPFSPQAKKTLELSLREALQLGHNYIGTEHILLGLIQLVDREGVTWLAESSGGETSALRDSVEQIVRGDGRERARSLAGRAAIARATGLAGKGPVTTGHLLASILEDERCLASRALENLGVTKAAVEGELARIPIEQTSDAPPPITRVEVRIGESAVTIEDPDVASAFAELTPEQLRETLQKAVKRQRSKKLPRTG
jgi:Clp amino terminal domain, pathogenicity island component